MHSQQVLTRSVMALLCPSPHPTMFFLWRSIGGPRLRVNAPLNISAEAPGDAYIFVLTFPYRDFFDLFVLHKLSRLHCTAAIRFSIAS
jgi:hypothetical protein